MITAYIGVGSNLGDRLHNCLEVIDRVDMLPGCRVEGRSDFFYTEPVGVEDQDWYINSVMRISTLLSPHSLLKELLAIETGMGRKREKKWDSRIIDLDILLFGQEVIREKNLTIPHPLMHLRRFVLVPLAQLAPDVIHPVLGETIQALVNNFSENGQTVMPLRGS